jgi:hypothetical protein
MSILALLAPFVRAGPYPEKLSLAVSVGEKQRTLDLKVNHQLFADGWALEEYGEDGTLRRRVTNPSEFMCHYTGMIRGDTSSFAAFTRCDNLEWSGHVYVASQNRLFGLRQEGEQLVGFVPNVTEDNVDDDEDMIAGLRDALSIAEPQNLPSNAHYVNQEGLVSDEYRMKQFSNSDAEAKSTQAAVNSANQLYANAKWEHGNTITNKIKVQQQVPPGWPKHSTPYSKPKDSGEKFRQYCKDELIGKNKVTGCSLLNGKAGAWTGAILAESVEQGMCGNSATSNFRIPEATINPVEFAHEWGHRYGFEHIKGSAGKGCIMFPAIQKQARFCPESIQLWEQNRGKTGACLLGKVRQPLMV